MSGMMRLSDLLKLLGWYIAAVVVLAFGNRLADSFLYRQHATDGVRWVGVAIAVAVWIPMLTLVGYSIRLGDEYQRHIFLVGLALAFGGTVLTLIGIEGMREAGLIAPGYRPTYLIILAALWGLGTAASMIYHRLRR